MVYDDTLPPTDDELVRNHEEILETPDQVDWPGEVVPIDSLPSDHPAVQYLESRNFPVSVLSSALGVKYCTSAENRYRIARDRIIIPLFMHGKMKAWQARYVGTPPLKSVVKYWTTPKVKKKALLYNFDVARSRKFVVLTEGPTDVWRFGPEAVSILGHKASSTQLQLITANWDRVVVLLDPDASDDGVGIYDILRNCGKASLQVALVELTGSDPGDMATADLRNFVFSEAYRQGVILETT
jgi:DNA primase